MTRVRNQKHVKSDKRSRDVLGSLERKNHKITPTSIRIENECLSSKMGELYKNVNGKSSFYRHFSNTILLVELNHANFESITWVYLLYSPAFRNVIFCGPTANTYILKQLTMDSSFKYIPYDASSGGSFFYTCLTIVMQMQLHVNGYLLISDDVILNLHKIHGLNLSLPLSTIHQPYISGRQFDIFSLKFCDSPFIECNSSMFRHYIRLYGSQVRRAFNRLTTRAKFDVEIKTALEYLRHNAGGNNRFFGVPHDVVYVPQRFANRFIKIASVFYEERVFIEIALPTTMHMLVDRDQIQYYQGIQMTYRKNRNKPWKRWKEFILKDRVYIHPAKWGLITNNNDTRTFYCKVVMQYYIRSLMNSG